MLFEFWDNPDDPFVPTGITTTEARLAFKAGMESQQNGTPKEKNPYTHGIRAYAWLKGWKQSYFNKYGKHDLSKSSFPPTHPSSDSGSSNG